MALDAVVTLTGWRKQAIDQTAHAVAAAVILTPLATPLPGWAAYPLVAMLAGTYREISQMRRAKVKNYWHWDRTVDVLFHAPGGLVVWLIAG